MIKFKNYSLYFLSISSIFVYRYYWSTVSQWREDQSTNIWLAYTKNISDLPIGLLSSKMIPNPNGIIIYGKINTAILLFTIYKNHFVILLKTNMLKKMFISLIKRITKLNLAPNNILFSPSFFITKSIKQVLLHTYEKRKKLVTIL